MSTEHPTSELYDPISRARKANKLRAMLFDFFGDDCSRLRGADIGCSTGMIAANLAQDLGWVIGIDLDHPSLSHAHRHSARFNVLFLVADALRIPFASESLDLAVCAQNYEHVSDAHCLSEEIFRILKPGGVCLFSGPNRLAIIEDHYHLPFLSWLPQAWADRYMRLAKRGDCYPVRPLTLWGLRRLWGKFDIRDYTIKMLRSPQSYSIEDEITRVAWVRFLPVRLLKLLLFLVPNYNWILQKPGEPG